MSARDELNACLSGRFIDHERKSIWVANMSRQEAQEVTDQLYQLYKLARPDASLPGPSATESILIPIDMADVLNEEAAAKAVQLLRKVDQINEQTASDKGNLMELLGVHLVHFDRDRSEFVIVLPRGIRDRGYKLNKALGGNTSDPLCREEKRTYSWHRGPAPFLCIPQGKIRDFFSAAFDRSYPELLKKIFAQSPHRAR